MAWSSLAVRDDNFRQHGIVLVVQGNEPQSVFKRGRRKDRVDQSGAVTRPEVTPKQTSLYRRFGIYRDLVEDRKQLGQLIFFFPSRTPACSSATVNADTPMGRVSSSMKATACRCPRRKSIRRSVSRSRDCATAPEPRSRLASRRDQPRAEQRQNRAGPCAPSRDQPSA